jgi:hypothetical protein
MSALNFQWILDLFYAKMEDVFAEILLLDLQRKMICADVKPLRRLSMKVTLPSV